MPIKHIYEDSLGAYINDIYKYIQQHFKANFQSQTG